MDDDVDAYERAIRNRELFWRGVWLAILLAVAIAKLALL